MNAAFKFALDQGYIEVAPGPDGLPLVVNSVAYYQASAGGTNLMMKRFHAFSDTLRKHDTLKISDEALSVSLNVQRDLLRRALSVMVNELETAQDCIRDVLTQIERIQQRRAFGMDVSQVYDLASLFYFSESEDPGDVDSERSRKKIADWLSAPNAAELYAFFLGQPMGKFLPLSALFSVDTLTYIQNLNELELLDWTRTLIQLRTSGLTPDTISIIESRKETLFAYDGLLSSDLNPITTT